MGAELVALATADLIKKDQGMWVTSACPVVVSLIERYYPDVCKSITPIVSPMVAHAKYLKAKYGRDTRVVFIGPCSAKKGEAESGARHAVDAVLTFDELHEAFKKAKITAKSLEPVVFDDVRPRNAQVFPLEGGLALTAAIASDLLRDDFIALSGSEHVREMVDHSRMMARAAFRSPVLPGRLHQRPVRRLRKGHFRAQGPRASISQTKDIRSGRGDRPRVCRER